MCRRWSSFKCYLVLPKLSSRAHFILLAPVPPLVDKAAPEFPPPAVPCLPGDAMATRCRKDIATKTDEQKNKMCFLLIFTVSDPKSILIILRLT